MAPGPTTNGEEAPRTNGDFQKTREEVEAEERAWQVRQALILHIDSRKYAIEIRYEIVAEMDRDGGKVIR